MGIFSVALRLCVGLFLPMLSDESRREIQAAAEHGPRPSAAAIDALQIVQHHYRWISDEHLRETADLLQMSAAELDGIATFYNQLFRRPVARHVVQCCNSVMCWMLGEEAIMAQLEQLGLRLGRSDDEGRFTLLTVPCLGACHRAPAMLVDGELYEGLDATRLVEILSRYP